MKSKRKKIILLTVIFIFFAITAVFAVLRYSANKIDASDVVSIEIDESGGNGGFIAPSYHYKIDFDSNTVTAHTDDPSAEPRHSYEKTTFTEKDKEYFIKYANYYGFFNWKKSYQSDCYDMSSANICITFKNGTQKNINCYGEFPLTYKSMKKVFEKAFGHNIL